MADGTVKWFNPRGFGLIVPDDLTRDVFVHFSSIEDTRSGKLIEGQRVEFDAVAGTRGPRATWVRPLSPGRDDGRALGPSYGGRAQQTTEEAGPGENAHVVRDQGRSFATTAGILGLAGDRSANAAFNRALRGRSSAEQAWLRSRELARLDALTSRLRGRDDLSVEEVVRQLCGLKHQREMVIVA